MYVSFFQNHFIYLFTYRVHVIVIVHTAVPTTTVSRVSPLTVYGLDSLAYAYAVCGREPPFDVVLRRVGL